MLHVPDRFSYRSIAVCQLKDHFNQVTKIAALGEDLFTPRSPADKRKSWWNPKKEGLEERSKAKDEELELRAKMLDEHISSYNERFLEIEDRIEGRYDSLLSVEDSVQKETQELEKKLSAIDVAEVMKDSRSDVLLKWLKVTLGMTTKATIMDEEDEGSDRKSKDSSNSSLGEPFTLFGESAASLAFDDSAADALDALDERRPMGILGERTDGSEDSNDDDDLLF